MMLKTVSKITLDTTGKPWYLEIGRLAFEIIIEFILYLYNYDFSCIPNLVKRKTSILNKIANF